MFDFNMPVVAIPANYREFLPSLTTPAVDDLIRQYEQGEIEMRRLYQSLMSQENRGALESFAFGAKAYYQSTSKGHYWPMELLEMFNLSRAISARQESYWFQLFELCGLTSILPAALWEKWTDSFTGWRTPGGVAIPTFDRPTVYSALSLIEAHRANFFSMRVDSVWKSRSGWHRTNVGHVFHERGIYDRVYDEDGSTTGRDRGFYDLFNLCSMIMSGVEDPFFDVDALLASARKNHCGEWVVAMDGVLRIRAYMRGTLHCEIHPEVATRLNIALAYIHGDALADEATLKPPRHRSTQFGGAALVRTIIPAQVRGYLAGCYCQHREDGLWLLRPGHAMNLINKLSGVVKGMIDEALTQIGGVRDGAGHLFDYAPADVVSEIVKSGTVPEKVSHQFYSTEPQTAAEFVEWVGVNEADLCYETSAGTGAIAKLMPLQTYCVEIDRLRAMALDKMGFEVKHADFLKLKPSDLNGPADTLLMNPPYAGRAWQDHIEHAVQFVKEGGVIGAILPEGAPLKMPKLHGLDVVYSAPMKNRFKGTSIGVVFAKWVKRTACQAQHELVAQPQLHDSEAA
jgi:predicted RNA methylase